LGLYDALIHKGANLYICGEAKGMAAEVNTALVDMLCRHAPEQMCQEEAKAMLEQWIEQGKYQRDIWAS
jgi:NADPH-ferrihemoprotein reductase